MDPPRRDTGVWREPGWRDAATGDCKRANKKYARVLLDLSCCSQANEGMWGMPGHTEAMKAVVSCEKLGGVAHTR